MSVSTKEEEEEEAEAEGTYGMMEGVMSLISWRPRALPVPVRVIAGVLRGDDDGICISNHSLTHLEQRNEELWSITIVVSDIIITRLPRHLGSQDSQY